MKTLFWSSRIGADRVGIDLHLGRYHLLVAELCCAPVLDAQIDENDAADFARILKALADPVRLRLVSAVAAAGEACACDLPELVGKSQPTVSHHLKLLSDANILEREQRGKWAWFRVNTNQLTAICAVLGCDC